MASRTSVRPLIPHLFPSLPITPPVGRLPPSSRTPGVPFFRNPDHVIPTCRLYRHVLRATYRFQTPPTSLDPGDSAMEPLRSERGLAGVRLRAIRDWHKQRANTSPTQTATFLTTQSTLLELLTTITPSSPEYSDLLARNFALHLSHKRYLARMAFIRSARDEASKRPPHLTGGFLRPTRFNPPLPRLRPQPLGISMMIHKRVKAHERRIAARRVWEGYASDMAAEVAMWKSMGLGRGAEEGKEKWMGNGWALGAREMLRWCDAGWVKEEQRKNMIFDRRLRMRVGLARARREGWHRQKAEERKAIASEGL